METDVAKKRKQRKAPGRRLGGTGPGRPRTAPFHAPQSSNGKSLRFSWRPRLLLRQRRLQADLSQAELAAKADMNPSRLSAYESGLQVPGYGALNKLGEVLELKTFGELIDPDSKFGEDNPPDTEPLLD